MPQQSETLQDRTRVLRDYIARSKLSAWKQPGADEYSPKPELDAIILTLIDSIHHLESRIAVLEAESDDAAKA